MKMPLKDTCAVVTGASKGIGLAITKALLEQGVRVAAVSRTAPDLEQAVQQLQREYPGRASAFPADVSREEEAVRVIGEIQKVFGRMDILVNCAGVSQHGPSQLETLDRREFERILHTNLNSVLYCTREALPHLRKQPQSFVLTILSTAAFHSSGGGFTYAASKYAARAVMEGLEQECKGTGVRIASISPGPVNTDIWSHKDVPVAQERKEKCFGRRISPRSLCFYSNWTAMCILAILQWNRGFTERNRKHIHLENIML